LYVLAIELPPLRERAEDIPLLAQHFLDLVTAEQGGPSARLTPDAALKMQSYDWSGNVRELQSVVQRSYLLSGGARRLDAGDIDLPGTGAVVLTDRRIALPPIPSRSEFSAPERDFAAGDSENTTETFREAKDRVIRGFESGYIRDVLVRTRGNVTRAAKLAGMQRRDFQRLMRKHDLSVSDFLP
jgi:two-component system response regulator GlrR